MHYDGTAFAMGNTFTILDKATGELVGRNEEISRQDFELLNKIYPSGKSCSETKPYNLALVEKSRIEAQLDLKTVRNRPEVEESWILVLNTRHSLNVPLIIDGKGQSKEIEFSFGPGTEQIGSCSIVWRGKMFVLGGRKYERQISVVDDCKLTKKGELSFDMNTGACAQRDDREVFICFEHWWDSSTNKNCRRSNGPLEAFSKLSKSTYDHRWTSIAAISGKP